MRLAEFIDANRKEISQEWEAFARSRHAAGAELSDLLLLDHIEEILTAVVEDMSKPQSSEQQAEKSKGGGEDTGIDHAAEVHARQRVDIGFQLDEAAAEFRALRASVVRMWEASTPEITAVDRSDMIRFNEAIDEILVGSMTMYTGRRERYREQFLAILGHDLRNPLTAILMTAGTLSQAKDLDPRHVRAVARILHSAERMNRLLSDVLDLTRIRLGAGLPLTPVAMNLETTCRHVIDELAAGHPTCALRFEPSGDLHGEWDADRLAQVVSNLTANALQHGDKGGPVVVSAGADGDHVVLCVRNQGRPIPPEDMGRIFEPLVQSDPQTTKPAASLGLGLFIVQEIVTAHGGKIAVTSSAENGTSFTIRLPRRTPAHPAGTSTGSAA